LKTIFVNNIREEDNVIKAYAVYNTTVLEGLAVIYPKDVVDGYMNSAKKDVKGIYFFDRFCQFIIFVQIKTTPKFDGSIVFIDCKNSPEAALDEYLGFKDKGWKMEHINVFMKRFQDIEKDISPGFAKLAIKDPIA